MLTSKRVAKENECLEDWLLSRKSAEKTVAKKVGLELERRQAVQEDDS